MAEKTEGVFPWFIEGTSSTETGLTIRDYFAAKAMQVILENYDIASSFEDSEVNDPKGMPALIAMDAYAMADAMLKARKR